MLSATITRPAVAANRPGIRFGLIDYALLRWTARWLRPIPTGSLSSSETSPSWSVPKLSSC
jgi:hypothetical protein